MNVLRKLIAWVWSWFSPTVSDTGNVYVVPSAPVVDEPEKIRATKAYADERQKAPRNRRRKPSKAMRNLYKLA